MDNYDNFFNGINNSTERTPIYHTPDSSGGGPNKKMTTITVLFVIIAVIMCIAIVANVIVLASMKNQVAQNYADTLTQAVLNGAWLKGGPVNACDPGQRPPAGGV